MRTFDDAKGRVWQIDISAIELREIRQTCDFRLTDIFVEELAGLKRLHADFVLLVDCIWACCKTQCEEQGVAREDFLRAINGDALGKAATALVEATIDFFPDPATRDLCRQIMETITAADQANRTQAMAALRTIDPKDITASRGSSLPSQASISSREDGVLANSS